MSKFYNPMLVGDRPKDPVLTLPPNEKGRDFVVGDLHGMYDLLDIARDRVGFDPDRDRLICVGDLVDRGNRSPDCIKYLKEPWFYAVRGNHDAMFMYYAQARKTKNAFALGDCAAYDLSFGMTWTEDQDDETIEAIYQEFKNLPVAIEIEQKDGPPIGVVHSMVPIDYLNEHYPQEGNDWARLKAALIRWDENVVYQVLCHSVIDDPNRVVSGVARLFRGHDQALSPEQIEEGNIYSIDLGAFNLAYPGNFKYRRRAALCICDVLVPGGHFSHEVSGPDTFIEGVCAVLRPDDPFAPRAASGPGADPGGGLRYPEPGF